MKSAHLPPVRVEASVRKEIESVLRNRKAWSQSVETAAAEAARRRKAQDDFLARGRSSLARAKRTGEFHAANEVLDGMRARLQERAACMRANKRPADGKP